MSRYIILTFLKVSLKYVVKNENHIVLITATSFKPVSNITRKRVITILIFKLAYSNNNQLNIQYFHNEFFVVWSNEITFSIGLSYFIKISALLNILRILNIKEYMIKMITICVT